ncbi:MAG: hypothetical protein Q9219_003507 [cf. Caloplaca sp. 3 TL-2023]
MSSSPFQGVGAKRQASEMMQETRGTAASIPRDTVPNLFGEPFSNRMSEDPNTQPSRKRRKPLRQETDPRTAQQQIGQRDATTNPFASDKVVKPFTFPAQSSTFSNGLSRPVARLPSVTPKMPKKPPEAEEMTRMIEEEKKALAAAKQTQ